MELNLNEKNFNNLSKEELIELEGGIAFVPLLIAGGKIIGAGVLAGAGWYAGEKACNAIFK